ncbi:MAG: putative Ig domain-containing protein [Alphaproteobacteria bacterium]|nr:putative Ig domain-containing protein [Alphaproteobacteria bacterium]
MATAITEPQPATNGGQAGKNPTTSSTSGSGAGRSNTATEAAKPRLYLKPAPWFGSYQLPKAVQSHPYEPQTITATNGNGPYTFAITTDWEIEKLFDLSHRLPTGLKLSPDGTISGTPTQGGTYEFKVEATDANGLKGTCYYTIAVELDLNHYLAYFDVLSEGSSADGKPKICRFDSAADGADSKPRFPLSLCEFLAYKAAQAYIDEDPKKPNESLSGVLKLAHPDGEINKHFCFFDSRTPLTRYTDEKLKELGKTPADKAPDHWQAFDKALVDSLNARRKSLDTQAFGFLFEGRTFIVCRGTSSIEDARVDIDNGLTTDEALKTTRLLRLKHAIGLRTKKVIMTEEEQILIGGPNPEAYLRPARAVGFAAAWAAIRDQVENWLDTLPADYKKEFIFSGHSLGGALAFVGAHEFAEKRNRPIYAVVTFGAPCVGMSSETASDKSIPHFVDSYRQLQDGRLEDRTIRLESSSDAVPKLMQVKNFSHVGRAWEVEFPPLPATFTLIRRKFVTGPLMYVAKAMLSGSSNSWSALPKKAFGYSIVYGLPLAKKVLAAHSADSRYALFLSTLAYRKIRSTHIGDLTNLDPKNDKTLAEKYVTANMAFQDHLGLIVGQSLNGIKRPRTIDCPKTELSYGRKYYGRANAQYLF